MRNLNISTNSCYVPCEPEEKEVRFFLLSFNCLRHRNDQTLYEQILRSCSVELILPQQPKAIRVTIHCRYSNQATGLLVVFIADNNSKVDPYALSNMSANPTLIKVHCCEI